MKYLFVVFLLCTVIKHSRSSWGDVDPNFQACLRVCTRSRCYSQNAIVELLTVNFELFSPPLVQIVPLSCPELCNYGCIDKMTVLRLENGLPVTKYYGHWPFTRYFGLEEPASSVFSVFNAIPHALFLTRAITEKVSPSYMRMWLRYYATVAVICWLCSAAYHAKKIQHTTQLDLISALGFILFGLFIAVRRILGPGASTFAVTVLSLSLISGWGVRAYYMFHGMVSFDSHMRFSIGVVVLTTTLWVLWVLHAQFDRRGLYAKYLCLVCQLWLMGASALEIFDFPPYWGIFDAHSLWHAVTVPLGFLWYHFWELDGRSEEEEETVETDKDSSVIDELNKKEN